MSPSRSRNNISNSLSVGLWAVARRLPVLPTLPRHVADFVATNYPAMELDALIAATLEVSELHTGNGLADPCTGAVTAAFQAIKPISPPHGWPTEERVRFTELPYRYAKVPRLRTMAGGTRKSSGHTEKPLRCGRNWQQ